MKLATLRDRVRTEYLDIFGGFACEDADDLPKGAQTLFMLGPREPGYWAHVTASREWRDGAPDPIDRWSHRVISQIAAEFGGVALFPFGGPPFMPFYSWALKTGEAWASPVSLLVHRRAGLMVSYRGAVALPFAVDLPETGPRPCESCAKPCLDACPVSALDASGYRVDDCRDYLMTNPKSECRTEGCAVRRACPLSQEYGRIPEMSAYHMSKFCV